MSLRTRPLTYDDLCQLPDDRNRYEIIGGALYVSPSPNRAHQSLANKLHLLVGNYVQQQQLGEFYFAPVDVRLTPHDVVEPDLLFIRQERLDIYTPKGLVEGPPDLVVEIISPSSRDVDQNRKARLYAASGVPEYWLIDPEERRFQLFVLTAGRYEEIEAADGGVHSTTIPGLVIDAAALFAILD